MRIGRLSYHGEFDSGVHGVTGTVLGSEGKDVNNGIAGLDGLGNILIPGSSIYLTREGAGWVYLYERTSDEIMSYIRRVAANAYELYINDAWGYSRIESAGQKNIANGHAGLDSSTKQVPDQHYVSAPTASNSTGIAGQQAYDANYFYLCYATDTWARFALSW